MAAQREQQWHFRCMRRRTRQSGKYTKTKRVLALQSEGCLLLAVLVSYFFSDFHFVSTTVHIYSSYGCFCGPGGPRLSGGRGKYLAVAMQLFGLQSVREKTTGRQDKCLRGYLPRGTASQCKLMRICVVELTMSRTFANQLRRRSGLSC